MRATKISRGELQQFFIAEVDPRWENPMQTAAEQLIAEGAFEFWATR